ncbi:MAG TPA: hypothetical protein VFT77_14560, partial [Reyranella sp.]|nr:hypothetical protein [Reyranella sp.]
VYSTNTSKVCAWRACLFEGSPTFLRTAILHDALAELAHRKASRPCVSLASAGLMERDIPVGWTDQRRTFGLL